MSQLYPERTIIAFLSVAPACHPCKLCLLKKIICAGEEPGSKCEMEGMVWGEGERLQGESWLGYSSAQSLLLIRSARCKMLLWTLLAQDPGRRRLWECGSQSGQQGVDPVLSECDPCPSHGFPLLHPGLSVHTSVFYEGGVISAPATSILTVTPGPEQCPCSQPQFCCTCLDGIRELATWTH